MAAQKRYLNLKELQEEVVSWSKTTVMRKIKDEGFPAIRSGGSLLFDRVEVDLWFKKRGQRAG